MILEYPWKDQVWIVTKANGPFGQWVGDLDQKVCDYKTQGQIDQSTLFLLELDASVIHDMKQQIEQHKRDNRKESTHGNFCAHVAISDKKGHGIEEFHQA